MSALNLKVGKGRNKKIVNAKYNSLALNLKNNKRRKKISLSVKINLPLHFPQTTVCQTD